MDIRATGKQYLRLKKLYERSKKINRSVVTLNEDANATVPVIMVKGADGALVEWTRGIEHVSSFLKLGYVRICRSCPYQFGKCRGEKCQLFMIRNGTGDCAHNWAAVMAFEK